MTEWTDAKRWNAVRAWIGARFAAARPFEFIVGRWHVRPFTWPLDYWRQ